MNEAVSIESPLENETDLVGRFLADIALTGLVGEQDNAVVTFLTAVSAKLSVPLQLTIFGESSSGKNHLMNKVAAFIPIESKKNISGMSPKTLMHAGENEYQNKAIFIAEYEGVSKADYAIRTMQSERVIEWEFVDSGSKGIKKKSHRVNGPAAFIQATTRSVLHPENETRMLSIEIDPSPAQTAEIIRRQAAEAANRKQFNSTENITAPWRKFILGLENNMDVIIPFAESISEHFPSERVRSRRDFPKLLAFIETSAYLHQHQRQKQDGQIVAEEADYQNARGIFEHCRAFGPETSVQELLDAATAHKSDFRVSDLVKATGWGKTKTYALLERAEEIGCIAEVEPKGTYALLRNSAIPPLALPERISA